MARFSVIGADGRSYGLGDEAGLAQWVREGRVTAATIVRDDATGAQFPAAAAPAVAHLFGGYPPPGPPAGYAQPVGYASPPAGPSQQGMAVAGFVLAFIFPILGLILSAVALSGMKKSGNQEGHGLAVAGLVISLILTVGFCLYLGAILTCMGAAVGAAAGG